MGEVQLSMIGEVLTDIANGPRISTDHRKITEALMRRMSEKGWTLKQLSGPRMMNRSLYTLQKYAREFEIAFPDYVPLKMRPKKGRKKDG